MTRKKAQAAIEFMTTYGWALIAILVAIGALSYFDFLNADRYKSVGCNTGSQIQCLEAQLKENGEFSINLRNNYPVDIKLTSVSLREEGETFIPITFSSVLSDPPEVPIPRGSPLVVNFVSSDRFAFPEGSKQTLDIEIEFSRNSGGAQTYTILGTVTVRVAPN